jgi:hypothetical protein
VQGFSSTASQPALSAALDCVAPLPLTTRMGTSFVAGSSSECAAQRETAHAGHVEIADDSIRHASAWFGQSKTSIRGAGHGHPGLPQEPGEQPRIWGASSTSSTWGLS